MTQKKKTLQDSFMDAWFNMGETHTRPFQLHISDNICEDIVDAVYPCHELRALLPSAEYYLNNNTYNNVTGKKGGVEILSRTG